MRSLGANLIARKNEQHGSDAWLWLVEVTLSRTTAATVVLRLTSFGEPITFAGQTYRPFPFQIAPIEQDDAGKLPEVILSLSNATREAAQVVAIGNGMIGRQVEVKLVHRAHLGTGEHLPVTFEVRDISLDDQSVAVRLGLPNYLEEQWPFDQLTRERCRWIYRDPLTCAYNGSLGACPKTLAACAERGDDEITSAKPVMHVRLFGGFPGAGERKAS